MKRLVYRVLLVTLGLPLALVALMGVTFGVSQVRLYTSEYPSATGVPDWPTLAIEEIPHVVTLDLDGSRRITQLWIAQVDGVAYLRTGDTQWFANLQRDPRLRLRIGGAEYVCEATTLQDARLADRVHAAFRAKYPRRSALFRSVGIQTQTVLKLGCNGDG